MTTIHRWLLVRWKATSPTESSLIWSKPSSLIASIVRHLRHLSAARDRITIVVKRWRRWHALTTAISTATGAIVAILRSTWASTALTVI